MMVHMQKFILENKVNVVFYDTPNMDKIVIYCHGFGENKESIYKNHVEILNQNNIGVIAFDFPAHGEDKCKYQELNATNSLEYLNIVYNYLYEKYNVPLCLMGSSYGGYIALCYIKYFAKKFNKVFLKYPAVNFYENLMNKLHFSEDYFNNNECFNHELTGYKLYKECFFDYKNHDVRVDFQKNDNDIYIIHGSLDNTVYLDDVMLFGNNNDIPVFVVDGGRHGLIEYLDIVNDKLINFIK